MRRSPPVSVPPRRRPPRARGRRRRRTSERACARESYLTSRLPIYWLAMSIDLLVFGPHPDDIEIGLGGTIARHAAAGDQVGLCDLTEGELSSNGTVDVRRREAAAAARVLGAAFRENLRWPDGGIETTPPLIRSAVDVIRHH